MRGLLTHNASQPTGIVFLGKNGMRNQEFIILFTPYDGYNPPLVTTC